MPQRLLWGVLFAALGGLHSQCAMALESRFASGLLRQFASEGAADRIQSEGDAVRAFLEKEYANLPGFEWRLVSRIEDKVHSHLLYALYYQGRRVYRRSLKLHYNRNEGRVEYASSDFGQPFSVVNPPLSVARAQSISARAIVEQRFRARYGRNPGRLSLTPVIWTDLFGERAVPAYEVVLTAHALGVFEKFFISDRDATELERVRVVRTLSAKVYPSSPLGGAVPEARDLESLDGPEDKLKGAEIWVRRQDGAGGVLREVDPSIDHSADVGFSTNPALYDSACTGGSGGCPDQEFDAVNVYYHVERYRNRLDGYLATLGASIDLSADPLPVIVNSLGVFGDNPDAGNNAAYVSIACRDDEPDMEACLVFLPPTQINASICDGVAQFHSLSREALVAVHEYQHYVTDKVTQMVPGQIDYNVGDALHEGYSDYFAATHVTALTGGAVTAIGEYGFQNCPALIRDVAVLKVYDKNNTDPGPHVYGWSWASGLWKMREDLGVETADLIALKSLFFLSPTPGFMDAVEALVQADRALNEGAHVAQIRKIFYEQVRFLGGEAGYFRDVERGVVEMGIRSCARGASRPGSPEGSSPAAFWIVIFMWLMGTLVGVRSWWGGLR